MRIISLVKKDPIVYFESLKVGDLFQVMLNGAVYMKVEEAYMRGTKCNAVVMESGFLVYFQKGVPCCRVNKFELHEIA